VVVAAEERVAAEGQQEHLVQARYLAPLHLPVVGVVAVLTRLELMAVLEVEPVPVILDQKQAALGIHRL